MTDSLVEGAAILQPAALDDRRHAGSEGKLVAAGGFGPGSSESTQTEILDVGSGPPPPPPPPPHYVLTTETGHSIVPGTDDIGNHCDDCTTTFALPFPVRIYGHSYSTATASANGNLQFTTAVQGDFENPCLPAATTTARCSRPTGTTSTPRTRASGSTRRPPVRRRTGRFYVEWRAQYYPGTGNADFELVFDEDDQVIRAIYGDL